MSYQGQQTPTEVLAGKILTRLIGELQRGTFSEAKLSLAFTNPDEFLEEQMGRVPDEERAEVKGIIKQTIITGFFRTMSKRGKAGRAED